MAKKIYIGVNNVSRKVKKMYIGVNGVARKVKKAYIGVNGVARLFFTGGELAYYGTDSLYNSPAESSAYANTPKHAIFHSGFGPGSDPVDFMTAFDATLVKTGKRINGRYSNAGGCIGKIAIFAGGRESASSSNVTSATEAFDETLTSLDCPNLRRSRCSLAGANAGPYLVFSGGETVSGAGSSSHQDTVYGDAYTESLTRIEVDMSAEDRDWNGATLPNYAIFVNRGIANAFDSSLTRLLPASADVYTDIYSGTELHGKAIFGDENGNLQVYNSDLTKTVASGLSPVRRSYGCTTLDEWAIFAGGRVPGGSTSEGYQTSVDAFDDKLTRVTLTALSEGRRELVGAHVGDFAFFAGGYTRDRKQTSTVDIYRI